MSGAPTRGMVAGQAIQTQAQTKEFDEGYERIFGKDRKPIRGRWRINPETGESEPLDADWTDAERRAQTATEELTYGGVRMTDGTDVSSKRKHREYLKRTGTAMASDFSDAFREREARNREWKEDAARKEQVSRDVYKIFGS